MSPTKIYLVIENFDYEANIIAACFSTKEKAIEAIKAHYEHQARYDGHSYSIEEWEVDNMQTNQWSERELGL